MIHIVYSADKALIMSTYQYYRNMQCSIYLIIYLHVGLVCMYVYATFVEVEPLVEVKRQFGLYN